jgi:hypothetical protein
VQAREGIATGQGTSAALTWCMRSIPKYVIAVCGVGALVGLVAHGPLSTGAAAVAAIAIVIGAACSFRR